MAELGAPESSDSSKPSAESPAGAASNVFVSYASQDVAVANTVCAALEAAGLPCWIAPRDVLAGESYAGAIVQAINSCRMLVLVLSKSAIDSPHVLREVERASSKKRPVLSIRMDASDLPPDLEYFLSANHWLDASGRPVEQILPALVESVRGRDTGKPAPEGLGASGSTARMPRDPIASPALRRPFSRWGTRALVLALTVVGAGLAVTFADKLWLSKRAGAPPVSTAAAPFTRTPATVFGTSGAVAKSVAVLPFADLSEKKDQEYFSDGLSDELIELLGKIPGLRVPARTSSFYFKGKQVTLSEIAKALNVSNVLEGSVRKSGNELRITAELVHVDNDARVWSESYDRKLDDVFKVQDEIAGAVVRALKLKLLEAPSSNEHKTASSEAYNQYLLGRQFLMRFNGRDARRAGQAFRTATVLDPGYASAWAGLADAGYWIADTEDTAAAMESDRHEARAAADKAVALQPDLAYGYLVRGRIRSAIEFDFSGGGEDLQRALALEPENPEVLMNYAAVILTPTGRLGEAVAMLRKATDADPLNARSWTFLGSAWAFQGNLVAARNALNRSLEISPEQTYTPSVLATTFLLDGRPAEALQISQRSPDEVFRLHGAAMAQYDLGHLQESDQQLGQLIAKYAFGAAYQVAEVYAWRGDKDHAFNWLERAHTQHDAGISYVKVDPLLRKIKGDSRYIALLRTANLQ
jgi:TolB-like protein/cytochrome c-type biogenesis protein CcmH/NrfG